MSVHIDADLQRILAGVKVRPCNVPLLKSILRQCGLCQTPPINAHLQRVLAGVKMRPCKVPILNSIFKQYGRCQSLGTELPFVILEEALNDLPFGFIGPTWDGYCDEDPSRCSYTLVGGILNEVADEGTDNFDITDIKSALGRYLIKAQNASPGDITDIKSTVGRYLVKAQDASPVDLSKMEPCVPVLLATLPELFKAYCAKYPKARLAGSKPQTILYVLLHAPAIGYIYFSGCRQNDLVTGLGAMWLLKLGIPMIPELLRARPTLEEPRIVELKNGEEESDPTNVPLPPVEVPEFDEPPFSREEQHKGCKDKQVELEITLQEKSVEISGFTSQFAELRALIESQGQKHDNDLGNMLTKHDNDLGNMREKHDTDLGNMRTEHESELNGIRQDRETDRKKHEFDIESIREEHRLAQEEARKQIQELRDTVNQQAKALKAKDGEIASLKKQLETLRKTMVNPEDHDALKNELETIKKALADKETEAQDTKSKLDASRKQLHAAKQKMASMIEPADYTAVNEALAQKKLEANTAQANFDKVSAELSRVNVQLDSCEKTVHSMVFKNNYENLQKQCDEAQKTVTAQKAELDKTKEVDFANKRSAHLETDVTTLRERIEDLEALLRAKQSASQSGDAGTGNTATEGHVQNVEKKLHKTKKELDDKQWELDNFKKQYGKVHEEINAERQIAQNKSKEATDARNAKRKMEKELSQATAEIERLRKDQATIPSNMVHISDYKQLQKGLTHEKARYEKVLHQKIELAQQIAALEQEKADLEKGKNSMSTVFHASKLLKANNEPTGTVSPKEGAGNATNPSPAQAPAQVATNPFTFSIPSSDGALSTKAPNQTASIFNLPPNGTTSLFSPFGTASISTAGQGPTPAVTQPAFLNPSLFKVAPASTANQAPSQAASQPGAKDYSAVMMEPPNWPTPPDLKINMKDVVRDLARKPAAQQNSAQPQSTPTAKKLETVPEEDEEAPERAKDNASEGPTGTAPPTATPGPRKIKQPRRRLKAPEKTQDETEGPVTKWTSWDVENENQVTKHTPADGEQSGDGADGGNNEEVEVKDSDDESVVSEAD